MRPELVPWMTSTRLGSVVTVAEIEDGVAWLGREDDVQGRRSHGLAGSLETLSHLYNDRTLAFGIPTARIAGASWDGHAAKVRRRESPI